MSDVAPGATVADYKALLQAVCDKRPSGTRGQLAQALGTNRSFVSQLVSPNYAMPIPAQHLETIFEVCHFAPAERAAFLAAYDEAHPGRREAGEPRPGTRTVTLVVPDLGSARRNEAVDAMLADTVRHLVHFAATMKE